MAGKTFFITLLGFLLCNALPGQEALKSAEEEYYGFLALEGLAERPYLNYRTLSDSVWGLEEDRVHPWQGQNLGTWRPLFGDVRLRVYGPELFTSANTAAPYGQNDGALWQGRGFNASLTGGVRLEGYGVEAAFKPQLAFSQNAAFDIMPSAYESEYGYFWGYAHNIGADAPQRFGNEPFFVWDWGDSEIRYTWKTLTVGFGTQAVWLGPAYLHPLLHSNNAPTYPKFDIGLRKQPVTIPWINWYAGDIEARLWVGYLSESDYFDNDDSNDHTMFHGLALAYAPSFLPGLTISANRVCLVPWEWENLKYVFPSDANTIEDQKMSLTLSWVFPQAGFEIFGEFGLDDFFPGGITGVFRYPFSCTAWTTGLKKTIVIVPSKNIYGELIFESNWLEMSQEFQFAYPYSFYFHHQITHGYTNRGQWIGNGNGSGDNSQYLSFILYYPKGNSTLMFARNSRDVNYLYQDAIQGSTSIPDSFKQEHNNNYWGNFFVGLETLYYCTESFSISGGMIYNMIINEHYKRGGNEEEGLFNTIGHAFSFNLAVKYQF